MVSLLYCYDNNNVLNFYKFFSISKMIRRKRRGMIVKRCRMYCSKSTGSGISPNKKNGNGFIKQTKIKCNPFRIVLCE